MVHALAQIRRCLVSQGILIDLRPLTAKWPVEVVNGKIAIKVGQVTDLPSGPADDRAAYDAFKIAAHMGWIQPQGKWTFPFYYYWDSIDEMSGDVKEKWGDFALIEPDVLAAAHSAWEDGKAGSRVRIRLKMHLGRWQKNKD